MDTLRDILVNLKNKNNTGITIVKGYNDKLFISYQQLYTQSSFYLNRLRILGVQPGQEFIIIYDDLEKFIYLYWACILGGIVPVPVSLKSGNIDKIINILSYCNNPYLFSGNDRVTKVLREKVNVERILTNDSFNVLEQYDEGIYATEYQSDEKDLVFIQFSSGSTNAPKGIKLTNHNILCDMRSMLKQRNITSGDKFLSWMPLTHDMGLIFFHLAPMFLGVDQILIPTSTFILHPLLWMQTISDEKATVTGGTNFCVEYFLRRLKSTENFDWNLKYLNHIILGAEMISVDLCDSFSSRMEGYGLKEESLAPGYGLAEATLCVSLTQENSLYQGIVLDRNHLSIGDEIKFTDKQNNAHTYVMCVGNVIDDVSLRVVDSDKNVLENGFVGLISLKGSTVTSGYYNNPEVTNETIDKDNWLNTGDIGFIYNNQLYITGRYKDIIFYNGKSYFSNDFEELIIKKGLAKRNEIIVVGIRTDDSQINDQLICFLRHKGKNLEKFYKKSMDIRKLMFAYAGVNVSEVIPVLQIPKTTSGKVKRFDLKKRYINQDWKDIILKLKQLSDQYKEESKIEQSTQINDIEIIVAECFINVLGIDVDLDENLTNYNMNSLSITKVFNQLDEKFPKLISVADLYEYSTVNLLADHIRAKGCK